MSINQAALDLIKEFEGFEPMAYYDPVGILTIGYGTTAAADVGVVPREGMVINEAQATEYLRRAVDKFAARIRPAITRPTTENQFGAMVSLAYNIGPGAFIGSTLLRKFNAGDTAGAGEQFLVWNKAGGRILRGLQRRREAERKLFLTPAGVAPAKPAPPAPQPSLWDALASIFNRIFSKGA